MRKGKISKRRIDRDFPDQVAIRIPVRGLVARLMAMHKFCDTRAMPYRTHGDLRRDPPADYVRFCFGDPAHADAFIAEFGGERITIEPPELVAIRVAGSTSVHIHKADVEPMTQIGHERPNAP